MERNYISRAIAMVALESWTFMLANWIVMENGAKQLTLAMPLILLAMRIRPSFTLMGLLCIFHPMVTMVLATAIFSLVNLKKGNGQSLKISVIPLTFGNTMVSLRCRATRKQVTIQP